MLKPGYGRWRQGGAEVDFFLEYDRGTEPLDRLAAKLYGYGELADATGIPSPVLFRLPTSAWEASVRQALAGEAAGAGSGSRWPPPAPPSATAPPTPPGCHSARPGNAAVSST